MRAAVGRTPPSHPRVRGLPTLRPSFEHGPIGDAARHTAAAAGESEGGTLLEQLGTAHGKPAQRIAVATLGVQGVLRPIHCFTQTIGTEPNLVRAEVSPSQRILVMKLIGTAAPMTAPATAATAVPAVAPVEIRGRQWRQPR